MADDETTKPLLDTAKASAIPKKSTKPWTIIFIVFLLVGLCVFLLAKGFTGNTDDDSVQYGDDDHTYEFWSGGTFHECLEFDDDEYFTSAVCGGYDEVPCFVDSPPAGDACVNSSWCDYFCGDMCALGEGALCFFNKLDNLTNTCKTVKEIIKGSIVTTDTTTDTKTVTSAAAAAAPAALKRSGLYNEGNAMELLGYGLHDDAPDDGCWAHSYCRFCTSDFCRDEMSDYLVTLYGNAWEGASVTDFKYGVEHINATCIEFGYDVYGDDDW